MLSSTPYFSMAASVSPPPASEKALPRAIAWAMARVPSPNCANSNTPTGPFQMMVPASCSSALQRSALSGPMSRIMSSARTSLTRVRRGGEFLADHDVRRQQDLRAAGMRLVQQAARDIEHLRLAQGLADVDAGSGKKGVGDTPAHDQPVDPLEQRLEHQQLGRDPGAADDRHQRPGRL